MAGGVLASTVQEGGIPYFTEETLKRWNQVGKEYLPKIGHWIQKANNALHKANDLDAQMVYNQTFISQLTKKQKTTGDYRRHYIAGVGFKGAEGGSAVETLQQQFSSVVMASQRFASRSKSTEVSNQLTNRNLLTEGYLILSQVGEKIRGDGDVTYKVVASTSNGSIGWSKAIEWNLNIFQFLNGAIQSGGNKSIYFDNGISSRLQENMKNMNIQGDEWSAADIDAFNMFLRQAEGFVVLKGKSREHPLQKKVKEINMGNALEAFLRLKLKFEWRQSGNKTQWLELKNEFLALLRASLKSAIDETLADPSPFWQGGEGGLLGNIQVKLDNASLTNMRSLVRQMTRAYAIFSQLPSKIGEKVKSSTLTHSLQLNDDEALDAIVEMFYRDGWSQVQRIELFI